MKPNLNLRTRRPERFEAMWVRSDECENIFRKYWNEHDFTRDGSEAGQAIERCRVGLLNWSSKTFGNNAKVCSFKANGQEWDVNKVRSLFSPDEASLILSIPLGRATPDSLVWHRSRQGEFTVHSAYSLHQQIFDDQRASTSHRYPEDNWYFIWKHDIPPKIKMFLWRMCRKAVPTVSNLKRRRCLEEGKCIRCEELNEDEQHVLLSCSFARIVWALSNIPWKVINSWEGGCEEWMRSIEKKLDKEQMAWQRTVFFRLLRRLVDTQGRRRRKRVPSNRVRPQRARSKSISMGLCSQTPMELERGVSTTDHAEALAAHSAIELAVNKGGRKLWLKAMLSTLSNVSSKGG
ncbi:hypothetical protein Salat_0649300 [Sesamum alatum]|uniref:Reverse transcriptase zinc-binding domain-containing protein n=1 Tax=Sesamum alatum TaxID=300844 RepID=A0AAE1YQS0_9LAMI|nr:hypothetical protein Salat_0649300 [Sesamum alatum]